MCPYRSPSLQDCSFAGNRARGRGSSGRLGRQDLVGPVTSSAVQAPAMLVPLGDPVNGHVGSCRGDMIRPLSRASDLTAPADGRVWDTTSRGGAAMPYARADAQRTMKV